MLPSSRKAELTWSPPGAEEPVPVYRYRPPSRTQREQWRSRVLSVAGGNPGDDEIRRIVVAGVEELWSEPGDRDALVALWDDGHLANTTTRDILARAHEARATDPDADVAAFDEEFKAASMPAERVEQLQRLDDTLRLHYPAYSRALERRSLWQQMAPRVAVEMFCIGWSDVVDDSGAEIRYRRNGQELDLDAMARLNDDDITMFGLRIISAMFPGGLAAKKPVSPSGSAGATTSSSTTENPSGAPTAKAG